MGIIIAGSRRCCKISTFSWSRSLTITRQCQLTCFIDVSIDEIEAFSRKCHDVVIVKLLRLFAIMLELPDEDQLVKDHEYDVKGEDHLRYMHYKARNPEENAKVGELYSAGHTDLGSVTLLFRQPVAALQILNSKDEWKWVKPQDETITVNICDALSAMTGGYLKSSVHRVHSPPDDQAHINRLGVLYFARWVSKTSNGEHQC